jgi:hypothetical protein
LLRIAVVYDLYDAEQALQLNDISNFSLRSSRCSYGDLQRNIETVARDDRQPFREAHQRLVDFKDAPLPISALIWNSG